MSTKARKLSPKLQAWIDARRRHHLSHAHIQMARELGMNPHKLGTLDNHEQEPWKAPLPLFIEDLYVSRFGKPAPDVVISVEESARLHEQKKEARRAAKLQRRSTVGGSAQVEVSSEMATVPASSGTLPDAETQGVGAPGATST